jgi:hypothetical protein
MDQPAVCPVCGDNSIVPVERMVKPEESVVDILAFRCGKGHIFLVGPVTKPAH